MAEAASSEGGRTSPDRSLQTNIFDCSICLQMFTRPKVLPCGHTFCKKCLVTYVRGRMFFHCPTCKRKVYLNSEGVESLTDNISLGNLREDFASLAIIEKRYREVGSPVLQTDQLSCSKHAGMEVKFYCPSCEEVVCGECIVDEHNTHGVTRLATALKKQAEQAEQLMDEGENWIEKVRGKIAETEEAQKMMNKEEGVQNDAVEKSATRMKELLAQAVDKRATDLKKELSTLFVSKRVALREQNTELETLLATLISAVEEVQRCITLGETIPLIQGRKVLQNVIEPLSGKTWSADEQDTSPVFTPNLFNLPRVLWESTSRFLRQSPETLCAINAFIHSMQKRRDEQPEPDSTFPQTSAEETSEPTPAGAECDPNNISQTVESDETASEEDRHVRINITQLPDPTQTGPAEYQHPRVFYSSRQPQSPRRQLHPKSKRRGTKVTDAVPTTITVQLLSPPSLPNNSGTSAENSSQPTLEVSVVEDPAATVSEEESTSQGAEPFDQPVDSDSHSDITTSTQKKMSVRALLSWATGAAAEGVTHAAGWGRASWRLPLPWSWPAGVPESARSVYRDPGATTDGEESGSDGEEEPLCFGRSEGGILPDPFVVNGYGSPFVKALPCSYGRQCKHRVASSETRGRTTTWDTDPGRARSRDGRKVSKDDSCGRQVAMSSRADPGGRLLLMNFESEFGELFHETRARCYTTLQANLGPFLAVWWGLLFGLVHFFHVSVAYPGMALLYRGLGQPVKTCFGEFVKASAYVTHSLIWTFVDPWVQYGGKSKCTSRQSLSGRLSPAPTAPNPAGRRPNPVPSVRVVHAGVPAMATALLIIKCSGKTRTRLHTHRAYPGGASGRRGVCSFLRARSSCLAAGIAVLLSLSAAGLAPLTFSNKQEISQLSTTFDALKRDQDDMSATVDALKRDQDDMSATVDALKRDQDGMSATVDALKRDLDNERSRTATLEQRLHEIENTLRYTKWRGTCFKVFNTLKTFIEAAAACRADGGTLAMPRDADTNAFLISLYESVRKDLGFWIGLHDRRGEGRFKWVDGSALGPYNSWAAGEPDNANGDQDCVLSFRSPKYKWRDHYCHLRLYFICQAAPGTTKGTGNMIQQRGLVTFLAFHPYLNVFDGQQSLRYTEAKVTLMKGERYAEHGESPDKSPRASHMQATAEKGLHGGSDYE
ncbi:hypothetical protein Bbelb_335860 [Branchiostoma belcheri]|nr:hypothetical protein Bbelb_335860 [Branchiostoma belcheri]